MSVIDLWLPVLIAAVFVFVVSSVVHMVLQFHRNDFAALPGEADLMVKLRESEVRPGLYSFPFAKMSDLASEETQAKFAAGPVGLMTVLPNGIPAIGRSLVQWFLFSLLISLFVAYVLTLSIRAEDQSFGTVFRVAGTLGIFGYAFGDVSNSIWKGVSWSICAKFVFDGVLYGLATGAAFAWLWPGLPV